MNDERQFKGIWIPKEIWLDNNLSALDKVILAEIDSLDDENNGCYASNQYIADFCKCSESKVSKTISTLKKQGYIYVQNFDGRKRYIKSNIKYCKADKQKMIGGIVKSAIPHSKKCYADEQKMLHINIENNIDSNIDKDIYTIISQKFTNTCISLPKIIGLNESRKKAIRSRLKEYSLEQIEEMFRKAENSDFLTGRISKKDERPFKASFDWLMKPSNFIKVLEGNYDNREVNNGELRGNPAYRFKTVLDD